MTQFEELIPVRVKREGHLATNVETGAALWVEAVEATVFVSPDAAERIVAEGRGRRLTEAETKHQMELLGLNGQVH